jgi:transposase
VEVFAGIQRRRRYSVDQKVAVLEEAAQPGMTISYVARRHGISPSLLFGWRRRMAEGGKEAVRADDEVVARAEVLALQKRIRELERVLGKKTLENEILREAVKVAHKTNLISHFAKCLNIDLAKNVFVRPVGRLSFCFTGVMV